MRGSGQRDRRRDRQSGGQEASPFTRWGFLLAAGALVLVVLAAVAVVAGHHGRRRAAAAPRRHASVPAGAASPAAGKAAGCALPGSETGTSQAVPTAPPAGVTWQLADGFAVPSSSSDGPGLVVDDVASCFAHTPVGALIAAVQIQARSTFSPNWRQQLSSGVMPGPGRDAYTRIMTSATSEPDPGGSHGQLAGFAFVAYTPAQAVVQLVSRFTGGQLQEITTTVDWSTGPSGPSGPARSLGDWRIQLQPDGGFAPNAQSVPNLVGFIPWSGVG